MSTSTRGYLGVPVCRERWAHTPTQGYIFTGAERGGLTHQLEAIYSQVPREVGSHTNSRLYIHRGRERWAHTPTRGYIFTCAERGGLTHQLKAIYSQVPREVGSHTNLRLYIHMCGERWAHTPTQGYICIYILLLGKAAKNPGVSNLQHTQLDITHARNCGSKLVDFDKSGTPPTPE